MQQSRFDLREVSSGVFQILCEGNPEGRAFDNAGDGYRESQKLHAKARHDEIEDSLNPQICRVFSIVRSAA